MIKGMPKYSNWGPYKRWCQQTGRKVWCFSHLEDFCFDAAADQLAAYLGDIRNSTTTSVGCHGTLCNHRSAINSAFMCVFKALDDGLEPAFIMQIGRWRSFAMWNAFYNRSCCRLASGRTFSSGSG